MPCLKPSPVRKLEHSHCQPSDAFWVPYMWRMSRPHKSFSKSSSSLGNCTNVRSLGPVGSSKYARLMSTKET